MSVRTNAGTSTLQFSFLYLEGLDMLASFSSIADSSVLNAFRESLVRIDPDCEIIVDQGSGEVLVRGDFDAEQLSDAIRRSGLGLRVVDGGSGCCGGCGCG